MNVTVLTGRLTKDPELKYVGNGTPVAEFTVANNDNKEPLFMKCNAWEKTATLVAESLRRGSRVAVQGQLIPRSWTKDGQKHEVVELRAFRVDFLDPRPTDGTPQREDPHLFDDLPF